MFSRQDYLKYFDQIAHVERKMIYGTYDLGLEVDDPAITRVLQKIGDDEVRHYGYVLKMLREITGEEHVESRGEPREYCLGVILLRNAEGQRNRAYCVNLSKSGICLESERELPVGTIWDLEIQLFGKAEALTRRGKIVWSKKMEEQFYIHGIAFEL